MRKLTLSFIAVAAFLQAFPCVSQILTGRVKASDNQTFYAPKTDSWNVQVQWMLPEGDVAKKGDLVIVFDSGSLESQIEQEQVSLIGAQEELQRLETSNEQKLLESSYAKKRSELILEKSRIDAGISKAHLSTYDYEKNQLEFEKFLVAFAKAKDELKQVTLTNKVSLEKQKITIKKHEDKLEYNQYKLKQMSVRAQREGPVLYANHPWNGEKIFVGMTAQASWEIAEIPSLSGLYIEAWVHEVDFKGLNINQAMVVKFDAFPTQIITAKLIEISTQPEERKEWGAGVYYHAVFEFSNTKELVLLPGMSVQLEKKEVEHG
jgi:multidrug resistance efflux pump